MGPVYMRSCSQALRGIILGERIQGYKKKDRRNMPLLGKSFRVEYVYKDIHFIFTIYFMGKYYSDDLSVSVSPVKVHKLPTDIALSNSLAASKNAISNIY